MRGSTSEYEVDANVMGGELSAFLRHPAQLALALVGLSLGSRLLSRSISLPPSSRRAFELSMDAVNGAATHEIVGGPQGIDERLYVDLRTQELVAGELQPALAPVVEGYVTVGDRQMQLVGVDPLASPELEVRGGVEVGRGGAGSVEARGRAAIEVRMRGAVEVRRKCGGAAATRDARRARKSAARLSRDWFTERGAVVMAAGAARSLGLRGGSRSMWMSVGLAIPRC